MSTEWESEYDWDRCVSRAQAALDALDEYDHARNDMRLLRDLNRVAEGDASLDAEPVDRVEQRKDAEWDRAEAYREEHGEWPRQDRWNRDSGRFES